MKIIDLLNKIANGEEVPERINWGCHSYEWKDYEYKALDELGTPLFSEQAGYTEYCLNDEVEVCSTGLTVKETTELSLKEATEKFYKISEGLANKKRKKEDEILDKIEEKKIPEKICANRIINTKDILEFEMIQNKINAEYTYAINEIIDYLKSKGE